jgi:cytochrome c556
MRFSVKVVAIAVLTAVVAWMGGTNSSAEEKTLEIKACMKCQNTVRGELNKLAKAKEVNWDDASKKSKTWLAAANDMGKNKPPMGDEKSWKEQTEKYVTNVKAVDEAVGKKDATSLTKALGTFGASCGGCHSKHKPK